MGGIRFEADGTVTIITGTLDYGQGHASPFAQVLSTRLGIPFERIRLLQGDSDELIAGGGTGGSKSMMASGTAIVAGRRQGDRERQADRRACAGGGGRRHRIPRAAASSSPAPTARSASWNWRDKIRSGLRLPAERAAEPRRAADRRRPALGLPQWLPHRRGRGRPARPAWSRWSATPSSTISAR